MKVLFVISTLGIGGEQRVASILTNSFVKRGLDVDIATFKKEENSFKYNEYINIIEVKKSRKLIKNISRLKHIRNLIKTREYDLVIGFAVIPSILCSLAAIGTNVPVVVCERNDPKVYPILWKSIRSFAYGFASGAVFQTKDASQYFNNSYFKVREIIQNPLDINKIPKTENIQRENIIVSTSRLTSVKNHEILIKAFARVSMKYPEYTLMIYGNGPLKDSLMLLRNNFGLENKVIFHEATPDVLEKIKKSKIFILSSNHEGFPNSLAEAMAIGIPSISTNCRIGGPKDMITDGVNGLLIPVNDEEALACAILKLIEDDTLSNKMSKEAIKIKDKLSEEIITEKWLTLFENVKKHRGLKT